MAIKITWFDPGPKVWFRGGWFDLAMVKIIIDVEREQTYAEYFYQHSYNKGVSKSANTHDKGSVDDCKSTGLENRKRKARRGLVAMPRTRAQGFSPHNHEMLIGGNTAASGLRAQMISWANGRNGLVNNRADDSGVRGVWQSFVDWIKTQPDAPSIPKEQEPVPITDLQVVVGKCYLTAINKSYKYGSKLRPYVSVQLVQTAINKLLGKEELLVDGVFGPYTTAAFNKYRTARFGLDGASGTIGKVSLKLIFKETGMNVQVWDKLAADGGKIL